jgi:beta-phosphoglucomutase
LTLRAVVFDFDGVIANSEPLHLRAYQDVLADAGITLTERDYYDRYLGFDDVGVFRTIGTERGARWDAAAIDALILRKAARLEVLEQNVSILFPGAAATVRRAAAAVPLAIASGALGHEIRRVLDRENLTPCFVAIISAEDTTSSKPAPDPYQLAVAKLGESLGQPLAPDECVAIEDSVWGLESARAAGLRTVAVTSTYSSDTLKSADLIVSSLSDLDLDLLAQLCRAQGSAGRI